MDGAERVDAAALVHSPMLSMSQDFRRDSIRGRRSHVLLRIRRRFPRFVSTLSSQVPRQVVVLEAGERVEAEVAAQEVAVVVLEAVAVERARICRPETMR